MTQIRFKLFICLLLAVGTTASPYAAGDQSYSGSRSSFNTPVIGSELTSGMTSNIGLVGPVPAMVESRGFAPNSCFNIIDANFPLFSTYCSVLPQTTYSLPNFFGHQTKQEVDALLSAMRTTLESGCFSSLRLFVCPLFFPSCGTARVLPCARFCRDVLSRCNGPELASINCDALPEQSRFCPIIVPSNSQRSIGASYGDRNSYGSTRNIYVVDTPRLAPPVRTAYATSSQEDSSVVQNSYGSDERNIFASSIVRESPTAYGGSSYGDLRTVSRISIPQAPKFVSRSNYGDSSIASSISSAPSMKFLKSSSYSSAAPTLPKIVLSDSSINTGASYVPSMDYTQSSSYGSSGGSQSSSFSKDRYGKTSSSYGGLSFGDRSFMLPRTNVIAIPSGYQSTQYKRNNYDGSSYGNSYNNNRAKLVSFDSLSGIPATQASETFTEPPVDLSKCEPLPTLNPCFEGGPQFFPISDRPSCYIHCDHNIMHVRPCPEFLTWNNEIQTCDWPHTEEELSQISTSGMSTSLNLETTGTNVRSSDSYGRKKRSAKERKKRFFPFLPEFLDPIATKVPLGPPLPGLVPLPGFLGPIGIPGPLYPPFFPPFLFPPLGPIVPPILPPPVVGLPPPAVPAPAPVPSPAPVPAPVPAPAPPAVPAPVGPAVPPIAPGPVIPGPIVPPVIPMLPPFPPPFLGPFAPFGGSFGGPFGPIGFDPLFADPFDLDLGGGFPFGEDFYGGSPAPFLEPVPFPAGCKSKRRNGKCDNSYGKKDYGYKSYDDDYSSYDDDKYGYSKKSSYKKNGNFKTYGSKKYGGYSSKKSYGYDNDDNYYRKKRQYSTSITDNRSFQRPIMTPMMPSSYQSGYEQMRPMIPMEPVRSINELAAVSPCFNQNGKSNIAHPTDPAKYIACLNKEKYEIMDCPEGLIYDAPNDQCKKIPKEESLCDRLKPCMNDGQCYSAGPDSYKCTCRNGWTGERCEVPLSSCVNNPCGEGNECHSLKVNDYKQDYVCVCDGRTAYGSTCERNTVPNPCMALSSEQQYYAFAFSSHAYVQCNGELLAFQPCPTGLYWNQELKVCDRELTSSQIALDQPDSYQNNYNSEIQMTTFTRPSKNLFSETNIDRTQGSRYGGYGSSMGSERSNVQLNPILIRPEAPVLIDRSFVASPKLKPMNFFENEQTFASTDSYSSNDQRRESFTKQEEFQTINPVPRTMLPVFRQVVRTGQPVFRTSSYRR